MNRKTSVLLAVVIVAVIVFALSAATVLAWDGQMEQPRHAPVCYVVPYFDGGIYELQCYDVGKDIAKVTVKTDLKYELQWNNENVTLIVYLDEKGAAKAFWAVGDKNGDVVRGSTP
jgi:hypothetical protein